MTIWRLTLGILLLLLVGPITLTIVHGATMRANTANVAYTDAGGNTIIVESNTVTTEVLARPTLAGVPASILAGQVSTLTVTAELGNLYTASVFLPTAGCRYVAGSLAVTGATGTITQTTAAGLTVAFAKPSALTVVTLTYKVMWE